MREVLASLEDQVAIAFIFGSVAQGRERADSDLDLFVIGTAGYSVVTDRLYPIEERLSRHVQVLYFDPTSAQDRKSLRKPSMKSIFSGPKLFVLGDETKLACVPLDLPLELGQRQRAVEERIATPELIEVHAVHDLDAIAPRAHVVSSAIAAVRSATATSLPMLTSPGGPTNTNGT